MLRKKNQMIIATLLYWLLEKPPERKIGVKRLQPQTTPLLSARGKQIIILKMFPVAVQRPHFLCLVLFSEWAERAMMRLKHPIKIIF